ncbi:MAG: hypothetical protein M0Q38_04005 [Bacteroidales bacterium]|jgi:WD40 repeat protein|nr:hypothetical protein [Bacteroidales bacterium]
MASQLLHTNPFPGIRSYEIQEDALFFGRELQVKELIDKLSVTRFLAIVGSSGCGKSSLIRAGLIPSLLKSDNGKFKDNWRVTIFKPGDDPLGNLTHAVIENHSQAEKATESIRNGLLQLGELVQNTGKIQRHLIVIDQFEELFRYKRTRTGISDTTDAALFVELFLASIRQTEIPVYVVLSMRTDFLDDCTEFRDLSEIINQGYYLVPRMNSAERRRAITGPIQAMGSRITEELVECLLNDVGDDPDQLPIMQHALMRTWDYWTLNRIGDQPIGMEHYTAIGTMKEALSVHLEEIYEALKDHRNKYFAEKLFKTLTDVSKESRGTRRPTSLGDICTLTEAREEEIIKVIDSFREPGRAFLMPSAQVSLTSDSIIDISHESIMRVWTRLRKWVEEESQSAQLYMRLSKTAELYQLGKSGLWINPELQLALQWKEQTKPNATWAKRYDSAFERAMSFLEYSRKQHEFELAKKEKQQKRNLKRARNSAVILGIASIVSILFLIISLNLRFKAEASRKEATEKEKLAIFERKRMEEQRKEAILQKKISEQQQQIAEQQKIITEQQRQYAVQQQVIAQEQTVVAIQQKQKADVSRQEAVVARDEAQSQRKEAVAQKLIADKERIKAEESEKNTQRLRLLSVARSISIQANQIFTTRKDNLPALLALQAFRFNEENGGLINDPDIYSALSNISSDQSILRGHADAVRSIALFPDGKTLVSCSDDGNIMRWNINNPNAEPSLLKMPKTIRENFRCVLITSDSRFIIAGTLSGKIYVWKTSESEALPVVIPAHSSGINSLALNPINNSFASGSSNGTILLWKYDGQVYKNMLLDSVAGKITSLALSQDGKFLFYGNSDGTINCYDLLLQSRKPFPVLMSGDPILSLALSADGKFLAGGFSNGSIRIWDTGNLKAPPIELIGRHSSGITALSFSPDGNDLASSGYDWSLKISNLKLREGKPISIEKHDLWVYDIIYIPDNNHLISCSADKTIRIFSTKCSNMAEKLQKELKRNLTVEEWNKYVGADIPYQKSRSDLP